MLDTLQYNETPEGVDLELHLAGPVVRAAAWAIDVLIRSVLYIIVSIVLTFFGTAGIGFMLIAFFLIEWFYPVAFEVRSGATPGKKSMGILVVHDNGTPISFSASMIRNLLRVVDFFPFLYGLGLISMLMTGSFKRLGDLAAGTVVIYREHLQQNIALPDVAPCPLPRALTLEEQRAILEFAERNQKISPARQQELANILKSYIAKQDEAAVTTLYQYANWLHRG